ncbi:MAG: hypothetical protein IID32_06195 [Planctomycetes bacterium]|nr:hypothetical protein [Planctomycetota bacterium]
MTSTRTVSLSHRQSDQTRRMRFTLRSALWLSAAASLCAIQCELYSQNPKPLTPAQWKAEIVKKNIFKPARTLPAMMPRTSSGLSNIEVGPQKLSRPFVLIGVVRPSSDVPSALLLFDDPKEYRIVYVDDEIETIKVLGIEPTYLRCDYVGNEVRISVSESSDDALKRLRGMGTGGKYTLVGTAVLPGETYARFFIPGESRYRKVTIGDMIGSDRVVSIESGKVHLVNPDGYAITVETSSAPN